MPSTLELHAQLTDDLASLLEEKALLDAAVVTTRADTFEQLQYDNINVTTIKEMAASAVSHYAAESVKLGGRVEALRVRLHHLDLRVQFVDKSVGAP